MKKLRIRTKFVSSKIMKSTWNMLFCAVSAVTNMSILQNVQRNYAATPLS